MECLPQSPRGRDFSEFMKGEKGMMEALASVDEFGEQLRLNNAAVSIIAGASMMRNSIMQAFTYGHGKEAGKEEEERLKARKRAGSKASSHYKAHLN
ncbi:hypothetical protein BHJ80_16010 [Escherichia coli]|nr:hypothetical protein BHJ80_16010 [Escherichia coli]